MGQISLDGRRITLFCRVFSERRLRCARRRRRRLTTIDDETSFTRHKLSVIVSAARLSRALTMQSTAIRGTNDDDESLFDLTVCGLRQLRARTHVYGALAASRHGPFDAALLLCDLRCTSSARCKSNVTQIKFPQHPGVADGVSQVIPLSPSRDDTRRVTRHTTAVDEFLNVVATLS
jgi:hypothetical protein